MFIHGAITKNKYYELLIFEKSFPTIFDFSISLSHKDSLKDHWGFYSYFIIGRLKLLEFNIYDIRHQEGDPNDEDGKTTS